MKIYRYRPLGELLFKELLYYELYSAKSSELNDPLDLVAQFNFQPNDENELKYLMAFLREIAASQIILHDITAYIELRKVFTSERFLKVTWKEFTKVSNSTCGIEDISEIIFNSLQKEFHSRIDKQSFQKSLHRIASDFIDNSSVICFSRSNSEFLMWSHYASSHSGVCLEFEINEKGLPMREHITRTNEWIDWHLDIKEVRYSDSLSDINAFDYLPVLANHGDVDLMNLSKSRWHGYAEQLSDRFCEKTKFWIDEKELRHVTCSFQPSYSEDRIHHYNPSCLTGICFGLRTPEITKNRIQKMFRHLSESLTFFQASVLNGRQIEINKINNHA